MKSLLILRHAEAGMALPGTSDAERQLTARGHEQARELGTLLRARGAAPDNILCSAAVRARETADSLGAAAGWATAVNVRDDFYNASGATLMAATRDAAGTAEVVLLVAHAPGVGDLASRLTTRHDDAMLVFDAGTLAEIALDIDHWSQLRGASGALQQLLAPRRNLPR